MDQYNTILYEKDKEDPHIVYLTLNRPEKRNAVSIGEDMMTGEIQHAIRRADDDEEVKVVIIRGAGTHFCSGFDLSMVYRVYGGAPGVRPPTSRRLRIDEEQIAGLRHAVLTCKKITIAQVHGWCVEAGLTMAQSCDIFIAADDSLMCHRGQRLAFGGMPYVPLELLQGLTKKITEILITGRTITAAEAESMGIITKAVPPEDLESEVYNLAKAICQLPADAVYFGKMMRRHIYESMNLTGSMFNAVYHTLGTNVSYRDDEKDVVFIRDREKMGEAAAFRKLHETFDAALDKTKYFKSAEPARE